MYILIGICLLFGCFYVAHFGVSLLSTGVWLVTRGRLNSWSGRTRSNFLCALRTVPLALASAFAFAFVLPAFLLFEPAIPKEKLSYKIAAIAVLSAVGLVIAVARIFASWWQTRRLVRNWMQGASPVTVDGLPLPAYRIEHSFPVVAVVGTFSPRVFIAEKVLAGLDAAQLQASLTHEAGHIASLDNLKQIAMRLCSDLLVLPFARGLDRDWAEASEAAADETVARKGLAALDLASALVKIGRLVPQGVNSKLPAGAYLIEPEEGSLACRVKTLVGMSGNTAVTGSGRAVRRAGFYTVVFVLTASVLSLSLNTTFLATVHRTTEKVLAALQ
jgi:Zn-dependent protease with chaperone function